MNGIFEILAWALFDQGRQVRQVHITPWQGDQQVFVREAGYPMTLGYHVFTTEEAAIEMAVYNVSRMLQGLLDRLHQLAPVPELLELDRSVAHEIQFDRDLQAVS